MFPPEAACIPFKAPLADVAFPCEPFAAAGDPCACVCVVCASGFCDENLELILDIHELRRELVLESGGVVPPFFMSLPRLSIVGRFEGIFWGMLVAAVETEAGGDAGRWTAGAIAGSGAVGCSWLGRVGRPPWDDVFGGASLLKPGDEGACWRW